MWIFLMLCTKFSHLIFFLSSHTHMLLFTHLMYGHVVHSHIIYNSYRHHYCHHTCVPERALVQIIIMHWICVTSCCRSIQWKISIFSTNGTSESHTSWDRAKSKPVVAKSASRNNIEKNISSNEPEMLMESKFVFAPFEKLPTYFSRFAFHSPMIQAIR